MNQVILIGRLVKEPELKYAANANNTAICRFTLAVDRRFQKQGEEKQADFINCVAFGKTGEFVSKYFGKGRKIALTGSIQTRTWDDAEGKRHYVTEVLADGVEFVEGKKQGEQEKEQEETCPDCGRPINECDCLPF